jgi:hypothetical protein
MKKCIIILIITTLILASESGFLLQPVVASEIDTAFNQTESLYASNYGSYYIYPWLLSSLKQPDSTPSHKSSINAHKYLGWGALITGVVAGITGAFDMNDRGDGKMPSQGRRLTHAISSYTATGLAIGACTTGFIEYGNVYRSSDGFSRNNIHVVSGLVSTLGFVAAMLMARIRMGLKGNRVEDAYEAHGYVAAGSGAMMMLSIAVIKF